LNPAQRESVRVIEERLRHIGFEAIGSPSKPILDIRLRTEPSFKLSVIRGGQTGGSGGGSAVLFHGRIIAESR
jgi:hypothetical protein